jgi:glycosyltransferase involved in cell wall biosynthesis
VPPLSTVPRVSRVLAIAPTPFFGDRGCHVRIYEEARALAALGVETEVVTYPVGHDPEGVRVHRAVRLPGVRPSALGPSWGRPLLDLSLLAATWRRARRFRPHVLHAHLHEGVLIGTIVRALTGIPLIADLQGSLTEELVDHRFLRATGPLNMACRRFERWLTRRPDAILVSSAAASSLVTSGVAAPDRVVPLPDGVDLQQFRPGLGDAALRASLGLTGRRVVVFLGVLTPYQGVDALLDAVPRVAVDVPDVHFLVMGYPNEAHYRALVQTRGLAPWVSLPGRVPYAEAASWLGLGEVAVSPKQSLTEANGKLLNYMACGLPTVATDTPVNRELLGEHGAFVPVGDADALAARLVDLLRDDDRRRTLGEALRRRAEQEFAWPALARRLLATYERSVAPPTRVAA